MGALSRPSLDFHRIAASLTHRERLYCLKLVEFGGDRTKALRAAGYRGGNWRRLEQDPNVQLYLAELQRAAAVKASVTPERVMMRLDRIAEKAESEGHYQSAILANKQLGAALGMFGKQSDGGVLRVNGNGNVIQIVSSSQEPNLEEPSEVFDAEFEEVMALNGRSVGG